MLFTSAATVILALAAPLASAYPIKADKVNCRSGPGTNHPVVKVYNKGHDVKLQCQTTGTSVSGNSIWDKTSDGCYVSDFYVKTGHNTIFIEKCDGTKPPTKPPTTGGGYCKKLNNAGIELVKEFEGFVPRPAPDPIGLPTVGYGHLCKTKGCAEVTKKYKFPLTKATATSLLNDDMPTYINCNAGKLKSSVKLNDNQWAALASFTFNLGCGNFGSSSLLKRLNAGEDPNKVAREEFPKWVKAGGQTLSGLVRRRKAEVALFTKASNKQAFPKCT